MLKDFSLRSQVDSEILFSKFGIGYNNQTQFHTHLITAGVLVDAKRGGCQNNQGYRWRWVPGWQQEI